MMKEFTHLDKNNNPVMVDVGGKKITERTAQAQSIIRLPKEVLALLDNGEIITKKGPIFQTAIIAGIMGAKKTSDLIPLCHQLSLSKCSVEITIDKNEDVVIQSYVKLNGKTGVEMEALTACTVAALTVYDMCKAFSQNIIIVETKLISKTGGKSDYNIG